MKILDKLLFGEYKRCDSIHDQFGLLCVRRLNHDGLHCFVVSWYEGKAQQKFTNVGVNQ